MKKELLRETGEARDLLDLAFMDLYTLSEEEPEQAQRILQDADATIDLVRTVLSALRREVKAEITRIAQLGKKTRLTQLSLW